MIRTFVNSVYVSILNIQFRHLHMSMQSNMTYFCSTSFNITFKIRYVTLSKVFIQSLNRLFRSILGSKMNVTLQHIYIDDVHMSVCLSENAVFESQS